jgi:hypothetical protein
MFSTAWMAVTKSKKNHMKFSRTDSGLNRRCIEHLLCWLAIVTIQNAAESAIVRRWNSEVFLVARVDSLWVSHVSPTEHTSTWMVTQHIASQEWAAKEPPEEQKVLITLFWSIICNTNWLLSSVWLIATNKFPKCVEKSTNILYSSVQ